MDLNVVRYIARPLLPACITMDTGRVYILLRNTWDGSRNCGAKLCFKDRRPIEGLSVIHQEATYMAIASLISDAYGSAEWQRFPFTSGEHLEFHSPVRTIFAFEVAQSRKLALGGFTVEYRTEDSTGPLGNASLRIPHYGCETGDHGAEILDLDSSHHGPWYFAKLYPFDMQAIMLIPSHLVHKSIKMQSRSLDGTRQPWLEKADAASGSVPAVTITQTLPAGAIVQLATGLTERFWVVIDRVLGQGCYVGSVDYTDYIECKFRIGDRLEFTYQNVFKAYNNGQEL